MYRDWPAIANGDQTESAKQGNCRGTRSAAPPPNITWMPVRRNSPEGTRSDVFPWYSETRRLTDVPKELVFE